MAIIIKHDENGRIHVHSSGADDLSEGEGPAPEKSGNAGGSGNGIIVDPGNNAQALALTLSGPGQTSSLLIDWVEGPTLSDAAAKRAANIFADEIIKVLGSGTPTPRVAWKYANVLPLTDVIDTVETGMGKSFAVDLAGPFRLKNLK